jgi:hypothetical protein
VRQPLALKRLRGSGVALRVGRGERRLDVSVEDSTPGPQRARPVRPDGPCGALEAVLQARARRPAEGRRTWKTTVKAPSARSSKLSARIARARSESVPGTAKEFASSAGSCVADQTPPTSTASQQARTARRKRRTARVQRSSTRLA